MLFDISELAQDSAWIDERIELAPFPWEGGDDVACDGVSFAGQFRPSSRGVELVARFSTVVHLHCTRCLASVDLPVETSFRLFLVSAHSSGVHEESADDEVEMDADEVDVFLLTGDTVDLAAVVREQLDLALPLQILCREDCKGLCPGCGFDLNQGECACDAGEDEDDPEDGLTQLRRIMERRKGKDPSGRK